MIRLFKVRPQVLLIVTLIIIVSCRIEEPSTPQMERYFILKDNLVLPDGTRVVDTQNETQMVWAEQLISIYNKNQVENAKYNPSNSSY